ncbi:hypothetical protein ACIQF5_35985 [Streptomyces goshikiensis]|uniref:hypothetical protein n=1 Tax=Streptomyces goshikiensis TaxID=1942 RepID=UPI00382B097F
MTAGPTDRRRPTAKDLDAGESHVWSQAASTLDDQVTLGGKVAGLGLGGLTKWWEEVMQFGTVWGPNVSSDRDFGANITPNDADSRTDYWRDHSLSIENQPEVVAGRSDKSSSG